jgi:peptidyl-tRNA hydrolase, PTH2 family
MPATDPMPTVVVLSTAIVSLISGFLLGIYSVRGYLISPALIEERRKNIHDPIESDESDIDEDESILDHAPNWTNGTDADMRDGLRARQKQKTVKERREGKDTGGDAGGQSAPSSSLAQLALENNEECKLVLVVRTDLGMTKGLWPWLPVCFLVHRRRLTFTLAGKIAAQCSHATLACYKRLAREARRNPNSADARILRMWEHMGQAKIAVQVKSQDEMMQLMAVARSLDVISEVISDAGKTQIEAGSLTVLGVGPAPKSLVNQVTGNLKLL